MPSLWKTICSLFNKRKMRLPCVTVKIGCHWDRNSEQVSEKLAVEWTEWKDHYKRWWHYPNSWGPELMKRRLWAEHPHLAISASWLRTWDLPPCTPASMLLCDDGLYPWNTTEKSKQYAIGPSKFCSTCIPIKMGRAPLQMAIKCLVGGGQAVLLSAVAPCRLPMLW